MLENTNFEHYQHFDIWLMHLQKQQKARGFVCCSEFAGYGHRVSMSTGAHGVQKFGGCYLPQSPQLRPLDRVERDIYIFQWSPPGMEDWVQRCTAELNRTPRREDVVKSILRLELPEADDYKEIGLYIQGRSAGVSGQEAAACYELHMHVPLPSSVETDFRRPMRQLQEKHFPNIFWLRTPDPLELDELLHTTLAPQQRVMALWRTTIAARLASVWDIQVYRRHGR